MENVDIFPSRRSSVQLGMATVQFGSGFDKTKTITETVGFIFILLVTKTTGDLFGSVFHETSR